MNSLTKSEDVVVYLNRIALSQALWWFIENAAEEPWRTDVFFKLRERMRESFSDGRADESLPDILHRADRFICGFEDDESQDGIKELLADIRSARQRCIYRANVISQRPKEKPVCSRCGSDDVVADAWATWDPDSQSWDTTNVSDKGHSCESCGESNIKFKWVRIDDDGEIIDEH